MYDALLNHIGGKLVLGQGEQIFNHKTDHPGSIIV
jgi:hypothetical protein